MMKLRKGLFLIVMIAHMSSWAVQADTTFENQTIKIYINCISASCDMNFIRSEITFVNYVIDRMEADVHILITSQSTGSGGREYTLTFIGENEFESKNDTLVYATQQDETADAIRNKMVKNLKMGLMQYIAQTPVADQISISYVKEREVMVMEDKWNNWVFNIRLSGYANIEKSMKYTNYSGSLSANRVTKNWKIQLSANASYSNQKFTYGSLTSSNPSDSKYMNAFIVKSLSNHWSIGAHGRANSSTYSNIKASYRFMPAIEYNLFPYSESTRRELRFIYYLGLQNVQYDEITIYDKNKENLLQEMFEISSEVKQPWGTIGASLSASHYFHDTKKYHISLFTDITLRLFKGFSLYIYGGYEAIHDQLSLPNRGVTEAEIYLQRRQLETQYSYWGQIGFGYTFGSIYNNIVNPRFGN
ncbi:hypothetical protein JW824_11105 [bacterium]|nr:hypothetical protein [bacterium]